VAVGVGVALALAVAEGEAVAVPVEVGVAVAVLLGVGVARRPLPSLPQAASSGPDATIAAAPPSWRKTARRLTSRLQTLRGAFVCRMAATEQTRQRAANERCATSVITTEGTAAHGGLDRIGCGG
jgi:hypothetical protein